MNLFLEKGNIHIFYLCISAEKASGIDPLIKNFHIICLHNDDFWKTLSDKSNHFCLEILKPEIFVNNSFDFLKIKEVINWINSFHASKTCMITFKNTPRFEYLSKKNNYFVLNNNPTFSNILENKFNLIEIAKKSDVKIPNSTISKLSEIKEKKFPFVIQFPYGHTGNGTFIVTSLEDFEKLRVLYKDPQMKISDFISGIPININGAIINDQVYVSGLNIQFTGIKELSNSASVTCGNNYNFNQLITEEKKIESINICKKIGKYLSTQGYKGLFGIDLILNKDTNEIFLIELNPRQTANISFYNQIQNLNNNINALLIHIFAFLDYPLPLISEYDLQNTLNSNAYQIICRNFSNKPFTITEKISVQVDEGKIFFSSNKKEIGIGEEVFRIQFTKKGVENNLIDMSMLNLVKKIKNDINLNY